MYQSQHQGTAPNQSVLMNTPYQPPKKRMFQNNSVPRRMGQPVFSQFDHEQLYEEAIKMKQALNSSKEENTRLRTRVKMLESEMVRKEKSIEDFFTQNQFIQNAHKSALGGNLAPIAQTAQKYQQETFLVMSLKKQVKELKGDLVKQTDLIEKWRRSAKVTKFVEMEAELDLYREELVRLRSMLDGNPAQMMQWNSMPSQERPSVQPLSQSASNSAQIIHPGISEPDSIVGFGQEEKDSLHQEIQHKDKIIVTLQDQLTDLQAQLQKEQSALDKSMKADVAKLKKQLKQEQDKASEAAKSFTEAQKSLKLHKQSTSEQQDKLKDLQERLKQSAQK